MSHWTGPVIILSLGLNAETLLAELGFSAYFKLTHYERHYMRGLGPKWHAVRRQAEARETARRPAKDLLEKGTIPGWTSPIGIGRALSFVFFVLASLISDSFDHLHLGGIEIPF